MQTVKTIGREIVAEVFFGRSKEASVPQNTIYRHLRENNENGRGDTALNYFGRKISYGTLLTEADRVAGAFAAAGIKRAI